MGCHFLPHPAIKPISPGSPALAGGCFITEPPGKTHPRQSRCFSKCGYSHYWVQIFQMFSRHKCIWKHPEIGFFCKTHVATHTILPSPGGFCALVPKPEEHGLDLLSAAQWPVIQLTEFFQTISNEAFPFKNFSVIDIFQILKKLSQMKPRPFPTHPSPSPWCGRGLDANLEPHGEDCTCLQCGRKLSESEAPFFRFSFYFMLK